MSTIVEQREDGTQRVFVASPFSFEEWEIFVDGSRVLIHSVQL